MSGVNWSPKNAPFQFSPDCKRARLRKWAYKDRNKEKAAIEMLAIGHGLKEFLQDGEYFYFK